MPLPFIAAAFGGHSLWTYNRENYMWDAQNWQVRDFQMQSIVMTRHGMYREDIRDLAALTTNKIDSYLVVTTLFFGLVLTFFLNTDAQDGMLERNQVDDRILVIVFSLCFCTSIGLFETSMWFCMHSAVVAQTFMTKMLLSSVRVPFPKLSEVEASGGKGKDFEGLSVRDQVRLPMISQAKAAEPKGTNPLLGPRNAAGAPASSQRTAGGPVANVPWGGNQEHFTTPDQKLASISVSTWRYDPWNGRNADLRAGPSITGDRREEELRPGDEFGVSEVVVGNKPENLGVKYLKLSDGRGWMFDRVPGQGVMCVEVTQLQTSTLEELQVPNSNTGAPAHLKLFRLLMKHWQPFDVYSRITMTMGTSTMLSGVAYYGLYYSRREDEGSSGQNTYNPDTWLIYGFMSLLATWSVMLDVIFDTIVLRVLTVAVGMAGPFMFFALSAGARLSGLDRVEDNWVWGLPIAFSFQALWIIGLSISGTTRQSESLPRRWQATLYRDIADPNIRNPAMEYAQTCGIVLLHCLDSLLDSGYLEDAKSQVLATHRKTQLNHVLEFAGVKVSDVNLEGLPEDGVFVHLPKKCSEEAKKDTLRYSDAEATYDTLWIEMTEVTLKTAYKTSHGDDSNHHRTLLRSGAPSNHHRALSRSGAPSPSREASSSNARISPSSSAQPSFTSANGQVSCTFEGVCECARVSAEELRLLSGWNDLDMQELEGYGGHAYTSAASFLSPFQPDQGLDAIKGLRVMGADEQWLNGLYKRVKAEVLPKFQHVSNGDFVIFQEGGTWKLSERQDIRQWRYEFDGEAPVGQWIEAHGNPGRAVKMIQVEDMKDRLNRFSRKRTLGASATHFYVAGSVFNAVMWIAGCFACFVLVYNYRNAQPDRRLAQDLRSFAEKQRELREPRMLQRRELHLPRPWFEPLSLSCSFPDGGLRALFSDGIRAFTLEEDGSWEGPLASAGASDARAVSFGPRGKAFGASAACGSRVQRLGSSTCVPGVSGGLAAGDLEAAHWAAGAPAALALDPAPAALGLSGLALRADGRLVALEPDADASGRECWEVAGLLPILGQGSRGGENGWRAVSLLAGRGLLLDPSRGVVLELNASEAQSVSRDRSWQLPTDAREWRGLCALPGGSGSEFMALASGVNGTTEIWHFDGA